MNEIINFGKEFKKTRTKLGLLQKDLSDSGISRNHISDIESNKSAITPVKALKLYEKLVYFSLISDIEIDIKFDSIFKSDSIYFIMKKCYEDIIYMKKNLHNYLWNDCINILHEYQNKNLGTINFFLLITLADKLTKNEDYEHAYQLYRNALLTLRYDLNNLNIVTFENALENFVHISTTIQKTDFVVELYKDIENFKIKKNLTFRNNTYYTMYIFEKNRSNMVSALKYLDKYIQANYSISFNDKINMQLERALILINLNRFDDAINIYSTLIGIIDSKKYPENMIEICSSTINTIVKHNIANQNHLLNIASKSLNFFSDKNNNFKLIINLGQVESYIGNHITAKKYFLKAFSEYERFFNNKSTDYLNIIIDSFTSFKESNSLPRLVRTFMKIKLNNLDDNGQILYYKILSKFLYNQEHLNDKLINNLKSLNIK